MLIGGIFFRFLLLCSTFVAATEPRDTLYVGHEPEAGDGDEEGYDYHIINMSAKGADVG